MGSCVQSPCRSRVTDLGLTRTKGTRCMCDRHNREQSPTLSLTPGGDITQLALATASLSWDSPPALASTCLQDIELEGEG